MLKHHFIYKHAYKSLSLMHNQLKVNKRESHHIPTKIKYDKASIRATICGPPEKMRATISPSCLQLAVLPPQGSRPLLDLPFGYLGYLLIVLKLLIRNSGMVSLYSSWQTLSETKCIDNRNCLHVGHEDEQLLYLWNHKHVRVCVCVCQSFVNNCWIS